MKTGLARAGLSTMVWVGPGRGSCPLAIDRGDMGSRAGAEGPRSIELESREQLDAPRDRLPSGGSRRTASIFISETIPGEMCGCGSTCVQSIRICDPLIIRCRFAADVPAGHDLASRIGVQFGVGRRSRHGNRYCSRVYNELKVGGLLRFSIRHCSNGIGAPAQR